MNPLPATYQGLPENEMQSCRQRSLPQKKRAAPLTDMTFREALEAYIKSREALLSPRTIMEYQGIMKRNVKPLMEIKLRKISQESIQEEINLESMQHSPKTVRNIHGLISAVLVQYRPDLRHSHATIFCCFFTFLLLISLIFCGILTAFLVLMV